MKPFSYKAIFLFLLILFLTSFYFMFPRLIDELKEHSGNWIRSLSYTQHHIYAAINSDGSVSVEEWITFNLKGNYNNLLHDIPYERDSTISNVKVYKASSNIISPSTMIEELNNNQEKYPDSFQVVDQDLRKVLQIKTFISNKTGEMTYVYKYTLNNVLSKYNNIAQFYWAFIPIESKIHNNNVSIAISLPKTIEEYNDINFTTFGTLHPTLKSIEDDTISIKKDEVRLGEYIQVRLTFPADIIKENVRIDKDVEKSILVDASAKGAYVKTSFRRVYYLAANELNYLYSIIMNLLYIVSLLYPIIVFSIFVFINLSYLIREYKTKKLIASNEFLSNLAPALVSFLINGCVRNDDLSATILNLIKKGYLHSDQFSSGYNMSDLNDFIITLDIEKYTNAFENLNNHERFIIDWFIMQLGDKNSINLKDIQNKLKLDRGFRKEFKKNFKNWKQMILGESLQFGLFNEISLNQKVLNYNIYLIFFGFITMIVNSVNIIFAIICITFPSSVLVKSSLGIQQTNKWIELKKDLLNDLNFSKYSWEFSFAYSIPLNIKKSFFKKCKLCKDDSSLSNNLLQ